MGTGSPIAFVRPAGTCLQRSLARSLARSHSDEMDGGTQRRAERSTQRQCAHRRRTDRREPSALGPLERVEDGTGLRLSFLRPSVCDRPPCKPPPDFNAVR